MSYQSVLMADIRRHQGYVEQLTALKDIVADGQPLTRPQRALIETQMNVISGELEGGVSVMPVLEALDASEELIMLGMDDMIRRILRMVYETLVQLIRWAVIALTKIFKRARGLLMDVRATRNDLAELRHATERIDSFVIDGEFSRRLAFGSLTQFNHAVISKAYGESKNLANILMAGSYTASLEELGKRLAEVLASVQEGDPVQLLTTTNATVERAIQQMGLSTGKPGRTLFDLIGNLSVAVTQPNVRSTDPVLRSREIQTFDIDYVSDNQPTRKLTVMTPSQEEMYSLLGSLENGLLLILDFEKRRTSENLLKVAGNLQTQLNKVLRDLDHLRSSAELNDSMVALSRYMTAYAAWVQDPIDHYARYFLNLNATLLQVCQLSMRHYV